MSPNAAALAIDNARLQRELRAAQSRNRALVRALNDLQCPAKPVIVGRESASVHSILLAGRIAESFGDVPVLRFARDVLGVISGVELALLPSGDGEQPTISVIHPGELGGMAVVGEDDATGHLGHLEARR